MHNIKILVAHHKPGLIISNDVYLPIHVGKEISAIDLGIQGDNKGSNISKKNPVYCEMTAMYWGWKNLKADYIGLCHYRRYFTFKSKSPMQLFKEKWGFYKNRIFGNLKRPGSNRNFINQISISDQGKFEKEVLIFSSRLKNTISHKQYDLIVPTPYELSCRNVEQHFMEIGRDHLYLLKDIVKELNPSFYSFLEITLHSNKLYAANMFIARNSVFEDYCSLVFPILEEHLTRIVNGGWCINPLVEKCYSRISGYLAELLTSAYVYKMKEENRKILYVNSLYLEMSVYNNE